jgi:hypothetical protein
VPELTPVPSTEDRIGSQALRPVLRVIGIIGGVGGALGASVAGQGTIALGALVMTSLGLLLDLLSAMLRDRTFRWIATKPNPDARVLRELNIREAIRTGQLTSRDATSLLKDGPD